MNLLWIVIALTALDLAALIALFTAGAWGKKLNTDFLFGLGLLAFAGIMCIVALSAPR